MIELARYWIAASYFIAIGLAVEQMRRPASAWKAAGRERRFWVAMTLVTGFHGLGQYAAVAYVAGVLPRLRAAGVASPAPPAGSLRPEGRVARTAIRHLGNAVALRRGERTAIDSLALVAALLVLGSSFLHAAVIADHVEYYVPFGACFAIAMCAQAAWAALVYRDPRNARVLLVGAVGNGALAVVWAMALSLAGPLFIWSILASSGAKHHH